MAGATSLGGGHHSLLGGGHHTFLGGRHHSLLGGGRHTLLGGGGRHTLYFLHFISPFLSFLLFFRFARTDTSYLINTLNKHKIRHSAMENK